MKELLFTPRLRRSLGAVFGDKVNNYEYQNTYAYIKGNELTLIPLGGSNIRTQAHSIDLLWMEPRNFLVPKGFQVTQRMRDIAYTGSLYYERPENGDEPLPETKNHTIVPLIIKAALSDIDGKQIIQSLQALGIETGSWKIQRNYITEGLAFLSKKDSTGDGQEEESGEYVTYSFEDFLTDLFRLNA